MIPRPWPSLPRAAAGRWPRTLSLTLLGLGEPPPSPSPGPSDLSAETTGAARAATASPFRRQREGKSREARRPSCSTPQPRVDEDIGDIGNQVERDVDGRGHQNDTLHHGIIAVEHGIDDQLAKAGDRENLFGEYRA